MLPSFDLNVADEMTTRYRRTHNTPVRETEERLNRLYGGYRTILCNSGLEAVASAIDLLQPDAIIVDDETYFESRHYFQYRGIKVIQLPDLNDIDELDKTLWETDEERIAIFLDSPTTFGNWKNVEGVKETARPHGATVVVDNSIASVYYYNPLAHGADICVESYTKYVCGHGDVFAGGIALADNMKYLEEIPVPVPCPGLNSIDWVLSRRGNVASQWASYMVSRGLETLSVRMERHTASAHIIYERLKNAGVDALYSGVGGLITLPGKTEEFCKKLKRFKELGTFGCTYSNTDFFRNESNYKRGVCARLSIGLEDPYLLWEDIKQAL